MSNFVATVREFTGSFTLAVSNVDSAFELFSPEGERRWVPGWNPNYISPPSPAWEQGQVFVTDEDGDEATWIVTVLDRSEHLVEYYRVVPRRYVARVRVQCVEADSAVTVSVAYAFVGLSPAGNAEIEAMAPEAYAEKMKRWAKWIGQLPNR